MSFWILIVALAGAVAVLLAAVMLRQLKPDRNRADYDIAVYREQLAGVERDVARGILDAEAAERIRVEISRRILDADRRRDTAPAGVAPPVLNRVMAVCVVAVVLGGSVGLYLLGGAPGYGDLPLQQRLATSADLREARPSQSVAETEVAASGAGPATPDPEPEIAELIQRLRDTVAERPDDPRGLALLARNEAALGNFVAAHAAQQRLIDVLGADARADDFADLADMLVLAAGGYVSPEAEAAVGQALARDPRNGPARYFLGLMQAQTGRPDQAFETWRNLLEASQPGARWVPAIRAQIEDMAMRAGVRYTLPPLSGAATGGPSAGDIAAAQDLSPEDRDAMIRGMVNGLSQRLAAQGGSAAEWARLITALGVLGESADARAIWDEAQSVFDGDPEALDEIAAAARAAGLAP